MIPRSRRALALLVMLAIAAVLAAVVLPPDTRTAVARIGVVGAGILLAAVYLRRSRSVTLSTPERFELELGAPTEAPPSIASLRAVEMTVRLSTASALDFEVRLRPMLRQLARWRLLTNRGVDMERTPEVAERILGQPLASLVHGPGEPAPFRSPGVPLGQIDAAIDQLEQI